MKKGIMIIGIILAVLFGVIFNNSQNSNEIIEKNDYTKIKDKELPSYISEATILKKHGFTIGFSKKHRHAFWVAYKLDCDESNGEYNRSNYFQEDQILGKYSPSTDDYYASGYDKGHLIPAADNSSDSLSMHDSFLMSNVSPQIPNFNRGLWKRLENQVRIWSCQFDSIYVITGAVLNNNLTTIGNRKVAVPDYYYKSLLLYNHEQQSTISFYMYQYTEEEDLNNFIITTDSLESILGYDLFHNLNDSLEAKIESKIDSTIWIVD